MNFDVTLPKDKVMNMVSCGVANLNKLLVKLKSVVLIEDMVETLKFAGAMYVLTYFGRWFNGSTLLILAWVTAFSAPRIYQDNKVSPF